MTTRIFKYAIDIRGTECWRIPLPAGAKVLCVQMQHHFPTLWVEVPGTEVLEYQQANPGADFAPTPIRTIRWYGTGHKLPDEPGRYIDTVQMFDGDLVLHFYEEGA